MNHYIVSDPWKIIEDKYDAHLHPITESLMSLGNGRMGQRANYEETYTGESLQGNYIAGVYYPDKTRVGWWKNGYPEYFAKILNSINWIQLTVTIDGEEIDLAQTKIKNYHRELDMQTGVLRRQVLIVTSQGKEVLIKSERFYSIVHLDTCYLQYSLSCKSHDIHINVKSSLDFNIRNSDSNYDEDFWTDRKQGNQESRLWVSARTKKTDFLVSAVASSKFECGQSAQNPSASPIQQGVVTDIFEQNLSANSTATLTKCVSITSSFYYPHDKVVEKGHSTIANSDHTDFDLAREKHSSAWAKRWEQSDITIEGDDAAQQGIRFNIFQLFQTYSGEDVRLNIGPKGFTGEKYGGSTYWDTEAYCLPFYMCTTNETVAKNLLLYRHKHLQKAIENAEKLGFSDGAALYPMVTINGEECHNEWEITFEEIHRNGAIAFAIFNYVRYTGDKAYIQSHGLEVLIAISRFWSQRVHISPVKNQYVMLGVTGPNEYENNVDNNWYTNYIARWCLSYTCEQIEWLEKHHLPSWTSLQQKCNFQVGEKDRWTDIVNRIYLPFDEERQIFVQHDGFLDKEDLNVVDLDKKDRPINQKWSWDRILRSPFIKQADVLQGMYFFEDHFSKQELSRNFKYYEPKTVHESSLSPCVHAILAASLDMEEKAYEMYLRTARLDLDNYNNDTEDGCHITSMAGTWMSIVYGFAGMRIKDNTLIFRPFLPDKWKSYTFKINFRKSLLKVKIDHNEVSVFNDSNTNITINILDKIYELQAESELIHNY